MLPNFRTKKGFPENDRESDFSRGSLVIASLYKQTRKLAAKKTRLQTKLAAIGR